MPFYRRTECLPKPTSLQVEFNRGVLDDVDLLPVNKKILIVAYMTAKRALWYHVGIKNDHTAKRRFRKIMRKAKSNWQKKKGCLPYQTEDIAQELYLMASYYYNHNPRQVERDKIVTTLIDEVNPD